MEFRGHSLAERATTLPGRVLHVAGSLRRARQERIFSRRWLCAGRADALAAAGRLRPAARSRARASSSSAAATRTPAGLLQRLPPPRHAPLRGGERPLRRRHPVPVPRLDLRARRRARSARRTWRTCRGSTRRSTRSGRRPPRSGRGSSSSISPRGPSRSRRRCGRSSAASPPWRLPELATARRIEYDVRANWKLIFQNFSECYHCPPVHPALAKLSHYRSGANDLRDGGDPRRLHAHQREGRQPDDERPDSAARRSAELPEDERQRVYYYSVFPSLFLTIQPDFVMATRLDPAAVDRTTVVCEWLFAPESIAAAGLRSVRRRRDLGRHEPPGLAHVRARAAGRLLARVRARACTRGRRACSPPSIASTSAA